MLSLWEYADVERIRIVDRSGRAIVGNVADVTDAGERSDLEAQEDGITIVTDDKRLVEFCLSEIHTIEAVKKTPEKRSRAVV